MEVPTRRRLPMFDWQTAQVLRPDFENQLAAAIFNNLHSSLKHDCICGSHGITIAEEWSRLPSDNFIVSQCMSIAHSSIINIAEAIAFGWIDSPKGEAFGEKFELVEPTAEACSKNLYERTYPKHEDLRSISSMQEEIESSQSETWDYVKSEIEEYPGLIINCVKHDTIVPFPKNHQGQKYEIITRSEKSHIAIVDTTRKTLEWKLTDEGKVGNLLQSHVVAWKRIY